MSRLWKTYNGLDTAIAEFIHILYQGFATPIPEERRLEAVKQAIEKGDHEFLWKAVQSDSNLLGEILEFLYQWSWIPYFDQLYDYIKTRHVKLWIDNHLKDLPEARLIKQLGAYGFIAKSLKTLLKNLIMMVRQYETYG